MRPMAPIYKPALAVAVGLALCVLSLSGCSVFSSERPPVPDSTFTRVLVDTHLMTARSRLNTAFPPSLPDSVLQRYDVHREDLDATLRYYSERPGAFSSLYNGVIDTLNAIQQDRSRRRSPSSDSAQSERRARRSAN